MKNAIRSILGAFVLTLGFAACGNTDGLSKEELGESEAATSSLGHCEVTSETDDTQVGNCYQGGILHLGACMKNYNSHGKPALGGTLANGQVVYVDAVVCGL